MNLFATAPLWIVGLLVALLVAAAIQDAVQLRISNVITLPVLMLAGVAMIAAGLTLHLWQNVLVFAVVLVVGTLLFSREFLGGGDVKLFAAVALWADLSAGLWLLAAIFLCGGVLALAILFLRVVAPASVSGRVRTLRAGAGIPYGVAIAAGSLIVLATSQLNARERASEPELPALRIR